METTETGRNDLWRRLLEANARARDDAGKASQSATDRAALIEALQQDGASLAEIGAMLEVSRQAVHKMLTRHRKARQ
jgi:transcriptional regulator of acetoin/glycerol metabolism